MLRATLKGMAARKARLALTSLAVVLGSAFIAAALVLTASIKTTVDDLNGDSYAGSDVLVQPVEPETAGERHVRDGVPADTLAAVEAADGVADVSATVTWMVNAIDDNGKVLGGFAPTMAVNWGDESVDRELREGRAPESDDEVAVSAQFVADAGLGLGDTVTAYSLSTDETVYDIVGVFGYSGDRDSLAGATELAFTTVEAQRLVFDGRDMYTAVALTAAEGTSAEELLRTIEPLIGDESTAMTWDAYMEETNARAAQTTNLIGYFLLGFGLIAVFVSVFLIANTFTIVIAGRLKEIAMMRAIGASRGQVIRSVLAEALLLGAVASVVGAALGIAAGAGLTTVVANSFLDTGGSSLTVPVSAPIAAIGVGIAVTVLSALAPAVRASRIPPVEAMRSAAKADKPITVPTVAGAIVTAVGVTGIALGLTDSFGSDRTDMLAAAVGAGLVFVGVSLLTAWLSKPLVSLLGLLWSWTFAGKLGRRNASRNPRRTAVTAAALMIGVTLVTATGTLLTSVEKSLASQFEDNIRAELFITGPVTSSVPATFDPEVMDDLREVDGVDAAVDVYYDLAQIDGTEQYVNTSSDLPGIVEQFGGELLEGSMGDIGEDGVAVNEWSANDLGVGVGDTVEATFTRGTEAHELTVVAILADNEETDGWYVSPKYAEEFYTPEPNLGLVDVAEGADVDAVTAEVETLLADEPAVSVQNHEEYLSQLTVFFDYAVIAIQLLLGLAMVVAVIGVINTLILSVLERTRELGMLRAIGMTRGQTVRMVTVESVTIALFGAVLGVGTGLVLGWIVQLALVDSGIDEFAVPTALIAGYLAAAVLVGLLAAIAPAVRASKVNILGAIAYE
ncbi:ABC transporter permease [Glycomyces harbinensis]|uniref:Putative ABC transport system permease protein n=1 Tax=Glycomyces harbinensis TaxID=58114 RepID=A0A1G6RYL4_9ACTN|nr:ABC transporter permease [Glycomyces harbinensis]SDD09484.1 putative ABC transport system permease protein [Glycomyces harbinensis]